MYSRVRHLTTGEILEVTGMVENPKDRRRVLYLIVRGGKQVRRDEVEWVNG